MGLLAQQQPWFARNRSILHNLQHIANRLGYTGMCSAMIVSASSELIVVHYFHCEKAVMTNETSHQVSSLSIGAWGWVVEKPLEKWKS